MQVLLANFASAPRWVFARRCFNVGRLADWAGGTRGLAFDILKEIGLAGGTLTNLCGVAMRTRIAPETRRTSTGIGGGAESASCASGGVQLFRFPTLWTLRTYPCIDVVKGACFAWGSVAFGTSFVCFFTDTTRHAFRGSFNFRLCIGSTIRAITARSRIFVWILFPSRAFVAIVQA